MRDHTGRLSDAGVPSPADPLVLGSPLPGPELLIGSNIFRNTNGVVKIHGKEQLVLEYRPENGVLLLTIDLYGEAGDHIAHVRRNRLLLNKGERFLLESGGITPEGGNPFVRLCERSSAGVVFEASALSERRFHIHTGKFYSHQGLAVDITPHYCRIGSGTALFGDIVENRGGTVALG
jgi:hypothetical protein